MSVRAEDLLPYQAPETSSDDQNPEESRRSPEALTSDLEHLAKMMEEMGYRLEYGLYEGTQEFYARVTDPRTHEVVKHIPSEEMLELHRRVHVLVGNFLDERA